MRGPGECQEACLMRLGCHHWTWNTPASARFPSTCWLKARTAREGRREGAENKVSVETIRDD